VFEVYCNPKRHLIWNEKQIYICIPLQKKKKKEKKKKEEKEEEEMEENKNKIYFKIK
jgi:hypothetical protein